MIKDMFKTGLFLFIVATLSGVLLAFTESKTSPVIQENQLKAEIEAQNKVLPSIVFSEVSSQMNGKTITYKIGFDKNGAVTGAVFKVSPKGFGGLINTMVGINSKGKVTNYKILSLSETPGLGNKLVEEKFSTNMQNLLSNNNNPNFRVKKDGGDVDAITAATISSRAFCNGVREAQEYFNFFKNDILSAKYIPNSSKPQLPGGNK